MGSLPSSTPSQGARGPPCHPPASQNVARRRQRARGRAAARSSRGAACGSRRSGSPPATKGPPGTVGLRGSPHAALLSGQPRGRAAHSGPQMLCRARRPNSILRGRLSGRSRARVRSRQTLQPWPWIAPSCTPWSLGVRRTVSPPPVRWPRIALLPCCLVAVGLVDRGRGA